MKTSAINGQVFAGKRAMTPAKTKFRAAHQLTAGARHRRGSAFVLGVASWSPDPLIKMCNHHLGTH